MNSARRSVSLRLIACAVVVGALAAIPTTTAGAASIDQLGSQLSQEQSHQQTLSAAISRLSGEISSLDSQIALVQRREAAVRAELDHDRAVLATTQVELAKTRKQVAILKARLARAQLILARQLVSNYEGNKPDLVSVVLESNGFSDLLDKLAFLRKAESQQSSIITVTRRAKARADTAEKRLAKLEVTQKRETVAAILRERALQGMNTSALVQAGRRPAGTQRPAGRTGGEPCQEPAPGVGDLEAQGQAGGRAGSRRRAGRGDVEHPHRRRRRAAGRSAPRAAGPSPTRSSCASRGARTSRPTAPARRVTTRSSRPPGRASAAPDRPPTWPPSPNRMRWPRGSGTTAPGSQTGTAPTSSASSERA